MNEKELGFVLWDEAVIKEGPSPGRRLDQYSRRAETRVPLRRAEKTWKESNLNDDNEKK
jgi:hypothetical protein